MINNPNHPIAPDVNLLDAIDFLETLGDNSLTTATKAEIENLKLKELKSKILAKVDSLPIIHERNDGRLTIKIKYDDSWKQISAKSELELLQKYYNLLYSEQNYSLEDIYPSFMLYRSEHTGISPKTIENDSYVYKKFLQGKDITQIPLRKLTRLDLKHFYEDLTKKREYTAAAIGNLKSLLNVIFAYAMDEEIIDSNPQHDINFRNFPYKVVDNSKDVYSAEDRLKLLEYLSNINEIYSYAIQFDFYVTARVGEVEALKWSDVDWDNETVYISKQILTQRVLNEDLSFSSRDRVEADYTKSQMLTGNRTIPLHPTAVAILRIVKKLNPDGEYIFLKDGKPLITDTFNERLKKYCKEAGVKYHSSHKIRFCVASVLYDKDNLVYLQKSLGHSRLDTTLHYLRDVDNNDLPLRNDVNSKL